MSRVKEWVEERHRVSRETVERKKKFCICRFQGRSFPVPRVGSMCEMIVPFVTMLMLSRDVVQVV